MRTFATALIVVLLLGSCSAAVLQEEPVQGSETQAETQAEALALTGQAQMRMELGEISEGLRLLKQAVELAPEQDELVEEYGLALARVGMGDEAVAQLSRAATLGPDGEAILGVLLVRDTEEPATLESALPHLRAGIESVPHGTQSQVELVRALVELKRGEEAWGVLQPLLSDHGEDPRILLLAGQALRLQGQLPEATEYLRRAVQSPRAGPRLYFELVDVLAASGSFAEAAEAMGELVEREGATLGALTHWASLLLRAGERERAGEVLDDVLGRDGNSRDALVMKALLEAGNGRLGTAEQLYRKALATDPDDPDLALGLARLLMDVRRLEEARTLIEGVWAEVERLDLTSSPAGLDVVQERAALELLDRQPEAAWSWLERLREVPLGRRSLALWAEYFRLVEDWSAGLDLLRSGEIDEEAGAQRARAAFEAEFLLAAGDEAGAKSVMAPLEAGEEDDVLAALAALERTRRYGQGVDLARQALQRFPESGELLFGLAACLERSGHWQESVERLRELIAREPEEASALNYLGYMYADKGVQLEEAKELITKAVSLDPTSGAYQDSLGWVHFRLGELEPAEKHLTEAVRLEPFDATVHEHLGDLHTALGDVERARAAYRQALTCKTDEEEQSERIEEKLAALGGDEEK